MRGRILDYLYESHHLWRCKFLLDIWGPVPDYYLWTLIFLFWDLVWCLALDCLDLHYALYFKFSKLDCSITVFESHITVSIPWQDKNFMTTTLSVTDSNTHWRRWHSITLPYGQPIRHTTLRPQLPIHVLPVNNSPSTPHSSTIHPSTTHPSITLPSTSHPSTTPPTTTLSS